MRSTATRLLLLFVAIVVPICCITSSRNESSDSIIRISESTARKSPEVPASNSPATDTSPSVETKGGADREWGSPADRGAIVCCIISKDGAKLTNARVDLMPIAINQVAPASSMGQHDEGLYKVKSLPAEPNQSTKLSYSCTFETLPLGTYFVAAKCDGFVALQRILLSKEEPSANVLLVLSASEELGGRIVDASGAVVADARVVPVINDSEPVQSEIGQGLSVVSDSTGRFLFDSLPPKSWTFRVYAKEKGQAMGGPFEIGRDDYQISLSPGERLSGRVVVGETNTPESGVRIQIAPGIHAGERATTVSTNTEGRFEFTELFPGRYTVRSVDKKWAFKDGPQNIDLSSGSANGDLEIQLIEGSYLSGRLLDANTSDGISNERIVVSSVDVPEFEYRYADTNAEGGFRFDGLPEGKYNLTTVALTGFTNRPMLELTVPSGRDLDGVVLKADRGLTIGGVVVDKEKSPVPYARVECRSGMSEFRPTACDANGRFSISGLASGQYLSITATSATRFSTPSIIQVSEGGISDLQLVLDIELNGLIAGHVTNEKGEPSKAFVQCISVDSKNADDAVGSFGAISSGDGSFAVRLSTPGEFKINATTVNPDGIPGSSQDQMSVILKSGETRTGLLLVINEGLSIGGKILSEDGKPISGINVSASSDGGGSTTSTGMAFTKPDGSFRIMGLQEGTYNLVSMPPKYQVGRIDGIRAGTENVEFVLKENPTLTGRVLDNTTKEPVRQFSVRIAQQGGVQSRAVTQAQSFSSPDGTFSLATPPLGPMPAFIEVSATGYRSGMVPLPTPENQHSEQPIEIELEPGDSGIKGVIANAQGSPVAGAEVYFGLPPFKNAPSAISTADGTFEIVELYASVSILSVIGEGYATGTVRISEVEDSADVSVVLYLPATISGVVTSNGEPLSNVDIGIEDNYATDVQSGDDGTFAIGNLSPGKYTVTAAIPNGNDTFQIVSQVVTIAEGETKEIKIETSKPGAEKTVVISAN